MQIIGWIATLLSITGIFFNANKRVACWPIWLASNILWIIYFSYVNPDVPSVALWIVFSFSNVYGWIKWSKEKNTIPDIQSEDWIDVNNKLPKKNQFTLIYYGDKVPLIGCYKGDGQWLGVDQEFWLAKKDIKFWMPLSIPKTNNQKNNINV